MTEPKGCVDNIKMLRYDLQLKELGLIACGVQMGWQEQRVWL